jgi:hypothetical protein
MCDDAHARQRPVASLAPEFEPAETVPLEPVDSVELLSLIDNVTDVFMPDQGPAVRPGLRLKGTRPVAAMAEGWLRAGVPAATSVAGRALGT